MNLGTMRTEFLARGFDYLSSTRANQFLNDAYTEICESDLSQGGTWGFLETTVTGPAPYTFTDLRQVLSVADDTTDITLVLADRRDILNFVDEDLTTTGTALYWWLEGEVLKVYPANTSSTLSVRYVKVPTALSSESDTPLVPSRYHTLIVDGAVIRAYEDSDNWEAAAAARQSWNAKLLLMADALLFRTDRTISTVLSTAFHEDW